MRVMMDERLAMTLATKSMKLLPTAVTRITKDTWDQKYQDRSLCCVQDGIPGKVVSKRKEESAASPEGRIGMGRD